MTDPYKLRLEFDLVPVSLNKLLTMHFQDRRKYNQYWYFEVAEKVGKDLPDQPLKRADIRIVRMYYRFLDYDGLVGSMKPVVDGLQHAKVIKSDSWKCTNVWTVTQKKYEKGEEKLIVEVRDASS